MTTIPDTLSFTHLCMKPDEVDVVIYHSPCCDGFGSAFSAWYYLNTTYPERKVLYHPTTFNIPPPDVKEKNVLICDFSYKKEIMDKIMLECNKLVVLDHHKTAESDLKDLPETNKVFRMDHSGAYLTWRYFHFTKPVPKMIQYIQDNDIWTKKLDMTNEIGSYIYSLPYTFEEYSKLLDDKYIEKQVILMGIGMIKQNNSYINSVIGSMVPKFLEINNKYYFVVHLNSTTLKSELGNMALTIFPNCNFSAIYSINDTSTSFSLRSSPTKSDVTEIAKLYKGGGHRNASGINLPFVTSTIPSIVHDGGTLYKSLNTIYIDNLLINDVLYPTAYLNTAICQGHIATYLLQQHENDMKEDIQEVTHIMRNKNKDMKTYNCNMSIVWNYDNITNITTFNIYSTNKELLEQYIDNLKVTYPELKREYSYKSTSELKNISLGLTHENTTITILGNHTDLFIKKIE